MVTGCDLLFMKTVYALIFFAFEEEKIFCACVQPVLKEGLVGDDAMER